MNDIKNKYTFLQEGAKRQEAANKGIPDRVPIIAQMPEFARKELELGPVEFYSSPELIAAGTLEIMERYGIDGPTWILMSTILNLKALAWRSSGVMNPFRI